MGSTQIKILYEDAHILAVNKPNNVLVHRSFMARDRDNEATLLDLLHKQLGYKCYPVHRLDRKTSGVLLLTKKREEVKEFQVLFQDNKVQKSYYALVRGFAPETGLIESPVKGREAKVYKEAITQYKKIDQIELDIAVHPYPKSRYSLLELRPKTGRLHQLRIHMNKISHPIIGDTKYGDRNHNRMFESEYNCPQLFLHAAELSFEHPFNSSDVLIKAPFPSHWSCVSFDLDKISDIV